MHILTLWEKNVLNVTKKQDTHVHQSVFVVFVHTIYLLPMGIFKRWC